MPTRSIFFNLDNMSKTPEGYLILTGRMVDEGEIHGDFFSYKELKKTVPLWANKPITIEHEHNRITPRNYNDVAVGHIIKAFANDLLKEILCQFIITSSQGISAILEGFTCLSVGFYYITNSLGENINLQPEHLSLVWEGARPRAQILASKKNKINGGSMSEEEIAKHLSDLTGEELARVLSMTEEIVMANKDEKEEEKVEGTDNEENKVKEERFVIEDLKAQIEELKNENTLLKKEKEEEKKEKEEAKKATAILSSNFAKASLLSNFQTKLEETKHVKRRAK